MNEDTPSSSPLLRFVEAGMRLTYEFESLGELEASFGQSIRLCPVVSVRGWSDNKECTASLRLTHFDSERREIGHCLLDHDEIAVWSQLLCEMQTGHCCSELQTSRLEYVSRHGIVLVWQSNSEMLEGAFVLNVSSPQTAILPPEFVSTLIDIFDEFE